MITFEYKLYTLVFEGDKAPASLAQLNRLGSQGWGAARILGKSPGQALLLMQRQKGTNKPGDNIIAFDPATFKYNK